VTVSDPLQATVEKFIVGIMGSAYGDFLLGGSRF